MKTVNPVITLITQDAAQFPRYEFRIVAVPSEEGWYKSWVKSGRKDPWCNFSIYGGIKEGVCLCSYGGEVWPTAFPDLFTTPAIKTINNVGSVMLTKEGAELLNKSLSTCLS